MVNVFIVCELHNWPTNPWNNFKGKNCFFGMVRLRRTAIKSNFFTIDLK